MSVCCIRWGRGICCRISELSDFQVDESWPLNSSILKLGDSTLKLRLDAPTARCPAGTGSRLEETCTSFRISPAGSLLSLLRATERSEVVEWARKTAQLAEKNSSLYTWGFPAMSRQLAPWVHWAGRVHG